MGLSMPNVRHKGIMRIKWKMCDECNKSESKLFTVLNVRQTQGHCVRHLSLCSLNINTSKFASKWSQSKSAKMNKSLSCVSSTDSLHQFQTTGVWLTAAIFLIFKLFCQFIAIVLFLWRKSSNIPLLPLFPYPIFSSFAGVFESRSQIHVISLTNTCTFYPTSCNSSLWAPRCRSLCSLTLHLSQLKLTVQSVLLKDTKDVIQRLSYNFHSQLLWSFCWI